MITRADDGGDDSGVAAETGGEGSFATGDSAAGAAEDAVTSWAPRDVVVSVIAGGLLSPGVRDLKNRIRRIRSKKKAPIHNTSRAGRDMARSYPD